MKKDLKLVRLVHNPTAGEGGYTKQDILTLIKSSGYQCVYSSSKKKAVLKDIEPETEFIIIAGGDGTIRKVIMKLLDKKLKDKRPIALLPFGTANNIASCLNIPQSNSKNINGWSEYNLKKFDVGQVIGLEETTFFIESFGFGLFPRLMKELKRMYTGHITTQEEEFKLALDQLLLITKSYEGYECKIEMNDQIYEDKYLLVEIMNISSLGPNLKLSETADPGDGYFDVIMVPESQRSLMLEYLQNKSMGKDQNFTIKAIRTKKLDVTWSGKDAHVDDQLIKKYRANKLHITILDSLLEFVTHEKPVEQSKTSKK